MFNTAMHPRLKVPAILAYPQAKDWQSILEDINTQIRPLLGTCGAVASYIPALARVSPHQFGIALRTCDGYEAAAGDSGTAFSSLQRWTTTWTVCWMSTSVSAPSV